MSLPEPIGPYSIYREAGDFIFISGQIGIDYEKGVIPESIEEQTELVLKNIKNILESLNLTFDNVIKSTIFLKDINDFQKVNEIYSKYFNKPYPARSTVEVSALPKNAKVEIEIVAFKG
ncbi:MAG: Rid family detoxifying hydrolase [Candidatus Hydrothermales bacterium]